MRPVSRCNQKLSFADARSHRDQCPQCHEMVEKSYWHRHQMGCFLITAAKLLVPKLQRELVGVSNERLSPLQLPEFTTENQFKQLQVTAVQPFGVRLIDINGQYANAGGQSGDFCYKIEIKKACDNYGTGCQGVKAGETVVVDILRENDFDKTIVEKLKPGDIIKFYINRPLNPRADTHYAGFAPGETIEQLMEGHTKTTVEFFCMGYWYHPDDQTLETKYPYTRELMEQVIRLNNGQLLDSDIGDTHMPHPLWVEHGKAWEGREGPGNLQGRRKGRGFQRTKASHSREDMLPVIYLGAGEAMLRENELRIISTFCANVAAYTVHGTLGTGQNGMVLDVSVRPELADGLPRADAHYALKVCFNFGVPTTQARNAFVNEFNVLARLPSHRNVVRFLCQFVAPVDAAVAAVLPLFARECAVETLRDGSLHYHSTQFFLLERLSTTLQIYLRGVRGLVPLALAQRILGDVGAALRHLQLSAVVHLDVKPDNVLVELERGSDQLARCVLADFGTAQRTRDGCVDLSVDASGNLLSPDWGNVAHLAPEVLNTRAAAVRAGRAHTVQVDMRGQPVFELAVMAYEVLRGGHPLGSYPLACTDANGLVAYAQSAVSALPGDCPAALVAMLRRALAPDPALRPDLPELLECIATPVHPAAIPTPQPLPPPSLTSAPRTPTSQPLPPSPAPQPPPPTSSPTPRRLPVHTQSPPPTARVDATEAPRATVGRR